MTEPDFPTNEEAIEIKKHIENLFPKTADFLLYAKPFLTHLAVREKYEDYLLVLKKIGINGIEEMASRFTEFSSIVAENSIEPFKGIFEMLQKKDNYLQSIGANWKSREVGLWKK
ncbi:MAG TPA: hypothetical protein VNG53_11635 [Bacteroidia bacterium]|nr:hypothetical protein [Bacteroidia bacterium]